MKISAIIKSVLFSVILLLSFAPKVGASDSPINAYLFWGEGCPHCAKVKTFLSKIEPDNPRLKVYSYEIYYNQDNIALMQQVAEVLDADASGVPFLVIGDKDFIGFAEGTTDIEILEQINKCKSLGCQDSVASIVGIDSSPDQTVENDETEKEDEAKNEENFENDKETQEKIIDIPLFGKINALDFSLPVLTAIIGALDGFNPCAMWVLLFLISLLLGFNDRKKMWILGSIFIFASAFVYFLFMAAWLNLILFLGMVVWIRLIIGLIALAGGGYNLRKGIKNKDGGCDVTGSEKKQVVFKRLREIVNSKSLIIAIGGIIILAFAVNLVELVCSAGLPAVYTQVLALSDLSTWQYYGYILLYILFFMLDDLIIFAIAMATLKLTGMSTKYSRYSNIIGGILMIIIGMLLVFKPEWLMFG